MQVFSCRTCAAQYPPAAKPPSACLICTDDRQYVPPRQEWATRHELLEQGFHNTLAEVEPGVHAISVAPKLGIGQQAYLIQAPQGGNILFDCVGLLHPAFVAELEALGGIAGIAISHPHFYTACADWAEAFDCKVFLHAADKEWVTQPSPRHEFWEGEERQLGNGVRLLHLGGHFPGSAVLLWEEAHDGQGVMFAGDTIFPVPGGGVSFMHSFPNLLPLPAEQVARIGATVQRRCSRRSSGGGSSSSNGGFDRLYGPFPQSIIRQGAAEAVQRSVDKYCGILEGRVNRAYF